MKKEECRMQNTVIVASLQAFQGEYARAIYAGLLSCGHLVGRLVLWQ
jgi:hypothetical protein